MEMPNLYQFLGCPVVFLDFETTGVDPLTDVPIEIAGSIHEPSGRREFHSLIDPGRPIPREVVALTGITNEMVTGQPTPARTMRRLIPALSQNPILVAHNAAFDLAFLRVQQQQASLSVWDGDFICTVALARRLGYGRPARNRRGRPYTSFKLEAVAAALGLELDGAHRAGADIAVTERILVRMAVEAVENRVPVFNIVSIPDWAPLPPLLPPRARIHRYVDPISAAS